MKELVLSALLGLNIDCVPQQKYSPAELWKKDVCQVFDGYDNVKLKAVRSLTKPVDGAHISKTEPDISKPIAGRVAVKRRTQLENGQDVMLTTFYTVSAVKDVWVARRNINKDSVIGSRDVVMEKRDVIGFVGVKTIVPDVVGAFTERRFTKGQIILGDYLRATPVVTKGKEVNALLESGGIKISTPGVLLQNGYLENDTVKIKLLDTGAIKSGRVRDDETILLDF